MKYDFVPCKNFGIINFTDNEQDILKKLGKPDHIDTDTYHDDINYDKTIYYKYHNLGIGIKFFYLNHNYQNLTISSRKVIINSVNLYKLTKEQILDMIEKIYQQKKIPFKPEIEIFDLIEYQESKYNFFAIGLSLWFLNEILNDVHLTAPS